MEPVSSNFTEHYSSECLKSIEFVRVVFVCEFYNSLTFSGEILLFAILLLTTLISLCIFYTSFWTATTKQ